MKLENSKVREQMAHCARTQNSLDDNVKENLDLREEIYQLETKVAQLQVENQGLYK